MTQDSNFNSLFSSDEDWLNIDTWKIKLNNIIAAGLNVNSLFINLFTQNTETLLHTALSFNNKNIILFLISQGASPAVHDLRLKTPIDYAYESKNYHILDALLNGFDSYGFTFLHYIAQEGDYTKFSSLVCKGGNPYAISKTDYHTTPYQLMINKIATVVPSLNLPASLFPMLDKSYLDWAILKIATSRLYDYLSTSTQYKIFDMSKNNLEYVLCPFTYAVEPLFKAILQSELIKHDNILTLNFAYQKLSFDMTNIIAKFLTTTNSHSLTTLDFSACDITLDSLHVINNAIKTHPTLKIFSIGGNNLGNESCSIINNLLQENKILEYINFTNNNINCEGAILLLIGLETNTTIKTLLFSSNDPTLPTIGNSSMNLVLYKNYLKEQVSNLNSAYSLLYNTVYNKNYNFSSYFVNLKDKDGKTILHLETEIGRLHKIAALVALKANIDTQNSGGETPLHIATYKGDVKAVKLLLDYNANMYLQENCGLTPVDIACHKKDTAMLALFEQYIIPNSSYSIQYPNFDNAYPTTESMVPLGGLEWHPTS